MKLTLTVIFTLFALSSLANGWAAAVVPGMVGLGASIMTAMNHLSQEGDSELFSNLWTNKYESDHSHSDQTWLSREHHDHSHHMEHSGHTGHTGHTGHSDHSYHYEHAHEGSRSPVSCDPSDPNPRPG